MQDRIFAVLTGDVVDSEAMRAAGGPTVGEMLREAAEAAREALPGADLSAVDVFRGDSWQLVVAEPGWALRVALFLRAWVRAGGSPRPPYADTRVAIGIGTVRRLVPEHISESEGAAFVASGGALDGLGAGKPYRGCRLAVAGAETRLAAAGSAVASLLDAHVVGWTPKQAWALCGAWRGLTQAQIGETFGERFGESVSQVAVVHHLRAASFEALECALAWFENEMNNNI